MDDTSGEPDTEHIRLVDKGEFRVPNTNPVFRRWELNLATPERPFRDMVNCIAADSAACKLLALATENGLVYVFNFEKNQIDACIRADHWIGSLVINREGFLISNFAFAVCQYGLRSKRIHNRLAPKTKDREGFGPKGVIFSEVNQRGLVLFNCGYSDFRLYNTKTRKVLRAFSPFESLKKGRRPQLVHNGRRMVMNYNLCQELSVLMMLAKEDPHLYLWNLDKLQDLPPIKLYNPEDLPRGMSLLNSILISSLNFGFVLLQFNSPAARKNRISTVLIVIKFETGPSKGEISAKPILFEKLSRCRLPEHGQELFMSQVVMPFQDVPNPEMRMYRQSDGFIFILGTTTGNSLILLIDLLANKVHYWAYYNLSEGRILSPRKRGDLGHDAFQEHRKHTGDV